MQLKIYQIDAFATKVFEGNPAAVIPLASWLPDETMQKIAAENNLSETAFFAQDGEAFVLRWFTPKAEVDMCGHATLASAYVLFEVLGYEGEVVIFRTKSGLLPVRKAGDGYCMDFPLQNLKPCDMKETITEAFGMQPSETFASMDYIVVFEKEEDVLNANPDMQILSRLDLRGVCITAPSKEYDFVTRFFAPKEGIDEDPVTGSAFTQLAGYWQKRLGKNIFHAKQLSARGGEVVCYVEDDRIEMVGSAVKYLEGIISFNPM